jgi:uncharacterized membrane protein
MFAIYVCLRPALSTVELTPRLRLMRVTLGNFFLWEWIALLLLVITGYGMVFVTFGGFTRQFDASNRLGNDRAVLLAVPWSMAGF